MMIYYNFVYMFFILLSYMLQFITAQLPNALISVDFMVIV